MDGVPVKISEKYKPPKRICLPGSVLNKITILKEAKVEDYDFSFEKVVLAQVGRINDYKKSVQEKKKKAMAERLKELEEAAEKLNIKPAASVAGTVQQVPASPPSPPTSTAESDQAQYHIPPSVSTNMDMLAPLPVSNIALVKERCKVDNSLLSEFESDTSSPFDNMELKSINDLQELADVLGSSNKAAAMKEEKSNKPLNGTTQGWRAGGEEQKQRNFGYPCQYYPPGVYPVYPNYVSPVMADHGYQRYISEYNKLYQPSVSPPYVSPVPPPLPPKPPSLSSNPTHSSPAHSFRYPPAPAVVPHRPLDYTHASPSRQIDHSDFPPRLDPTEMSMWSDLQRTLQDRKTTILEESMPKPVISSLGAVAGGVQAPDAASIAATSASLAKLSQEDQALARRMSEMGFPLSRSARAVHMFSSDEAKVIEFLLQVQKFEDRGFAGDLVESALESNNLSEEPMLEYLENVKKLIDFGFSQERVLKAMEQASNNPDHALDILIS